MNNVTITDINIPFWRAAGIMLKWMFASIPALLVFYLVMFAVSMVMFLLFGGLILGSGLLEDLHQLPAPQP